MNASEKNQRILLPGGAGLVGQNLVVQLKAQGYSNLVVLDEHRTNLALLQQVPYLVHISSSVITSIADDFYTQTKKQQEQLVLASGISGPILRPTLMFGWFDRKHLGWLARFMQKVPLFPIPGDGRYRRQPLYVGDFCQWIVRCLEQCIPGGSTISPVMKP